MNEQAFQKLCRETPAGTELSYANRKTQGRTRFVGCTANSVGVEVKGETYTLPRDMVTIEQSVYPIPSYS